jgi:hypothetical protein
MRRVVVLEYPANRPGYKHPRGQSPRIRDKSSPLFRAGGSASDKALADLPVVVDDAALLSRRERGWQECRTSRQQRP